MAQKHKIRVQLLDNEYRTISDRLISQYEELLGGPTEPHEGPFRLEVTLDSPDTIEKLKAYLDRLVGKLPIQIGSTRKKIKVAREGKKVAPSENKNPYREIFESIKKKTHIEQIIEELESINFRWLTTDSIREYPGIKETQAALLPDNYQWLVRFKKMGKNPQDDLYDLQLLVGIRFIGTQEDKVYIFYKGKKKALWKRPWQEEKNINMKKKKIHVVFPSYLSIDDRKKWRGIRRKVMNKSTVSQSDQKFYDRYLPEIQNLDDNYLG